ncbi:MAG: shikimate kinase [Planctomycetota bacterium]|nr:shikimate kinase [Planctomycetota bacterium]
MAMKLVLIGLRGTGKSTIGRLLAERLRWRFFDTDSLVQERAGMTIKEIFARHGEPHFRRVEAAVVQECAGHNDAVIATGGGAILDPANVDALRSGGFVVHLTAPPSELWRRIARDQASPANRPQLVQGAADGVDELQQLMLARAAAYARARDVEVSVEGRSPPEVAEAIAILMRARGALKEEAAGGRAGT